MWNICARTVFALDLKPYAADAVAADATCITAGYWHWHCWLLALALALALTSPCHWLLACH
jgi:hypothetical protein